MRTRVTRRIAAACLMGALAAGAPAAAAPLEPLFPPLEPDRGHVHYNYPPVPYGYAQIVNVFGRPCSADAHANVAYWEASDHSVWPVRFHRRLGGGSSSNLDVDIPYHVRVEGYTYRRAIYGYACRTIGGTSLYSTHAWGIAVDVNSESEHYGHDHCHTVSSGLARIWQTHRWKWGAAFRDCMHFQYAQGY